MPRLITLIVICLFLAACSTRDLQRVYTGSTAQRLVTHSIDDLLAKLPANDFEALRGQTLAFESYFLAESKVKEYADQRLRKELSQRFGITLVPRNEGAENQPLEHTSKPLLSVFYTSLGTDQDNFGLAIPLGFIPGIDESTQINLLTLDKFHGIAELYYFIGLEGQQARSKTYQAVVRTDALGLPIITIPISNLDREGRKPKRKAREGF